MDINKSKKMYLFLKDGDNDFIWDEKEEVMFMAEGEDVTIVPSTLEMKARFNPYLRLIKKVESRPGILESIIVI